MTIDWTKPVRTKGGKDVRILCTDGPGFLPVIGLIDTNVCRWLLDGSFYLSGSHGETLDLENVPQRHPHADTIIAWANGAEIQCNTESDIGWSDTPSPSWNKSYRYRVKP